MLWAATTLVIKRTRLADGQRRKSCCSTSSSVSAVMALPMLLFAGPVFREVSAVPVAALLFQAIYVVAVTYVLWFWLMRRYPAAGLSSFAFLTPVFGVLCGGLLLERTAQHPHLPGAGADRRRADHRQPDAAAEGVGWPCATSSTISKRASSSPIPIRCGAPRSR